MIREEPTFRVYYGGGIYINGTNPPTPHRPVITNNIIHGDAADPPAGQDGSTRLGAAGGRESARAKLRPEGGHVESKL